MDKLLQNPCFRLVFVDNNDGMSRVVPANDDEVKKEVEEKGYRCISHLWGGNSRRPWDHGVVGVDHEVEIRDDNKKKCLELFKEHKGYWWMDVFCVNQVGKDKTNSQKDKTKSQKDKTKIPDMDALNIMGDIYRNCEECYCLLDKSKPISKKSLKDATLAGNAGDTSKDIFMQALDKCSVGHEVYTTLFYLFGSKWVERVWTLQECVLPKKVYFVAEYDESPKVPLEHIFRLCYHLRNNDYMSYEHEYDDAPGLTPEYRAKGNNGVSVLGTISHKASEYMYVQEIRSLFEDGETMAILENLSHSRRISTKPVDVNGVTSLLDVVSSGKNIKEADNSMVASLWSKDIFLMDKGYIRQISDQQEEDKGLSKAFARKMYEGMFVISNASDLKPGSMLKYDLGTVIYCINIGKGFGDMSWPEKPHCKDEICERKARSSTDSFPDLLCAECRKEYKSKFGIMVKVSDKDGSKRVLMDDLEVACLLTDDADRRSTWVTNSMVDTFRSHNVYVTNKYIVALSDMPNYQFDTFRAHNVYVTNKIVASSDMPKYQVGDDITIPLYGSFRNLYRDEESNIGYEISTIVTIGKSRERVRAGCIYNSKYYSETEE
ncbi:hypothetical protein BGZ76_001666 [Entomortierella beljakovae]|nr:hypothetical protein BGZ76_001666 [Entomortierella beljakovae]